MTIEQAIKKYIVPALLNTWNENKCNEVLEALSAELCENCISRQDALDAIEKKANIPSIQKNEDIVNGLMGAWQIVYEMPSVYERSNK